MSDYRKELEEKFKDRDLLEELSYSADKTERSGGMKPIYKPKGPAKEYGDLALNIYTGCQVTAHTAARICRARWSPRLMRSRNIGP